MSEYRIKKRHFSIAILVILLMLGTAGCGKEEAEYPKLTGEEARQAFGAAHEVLLTGDVDDVNTFSDVIADGQNVGKVKESGLIHNRITYSVENEDQFYVAFCDYEKEDSVVEDDRYATSTTYTYYDMDGNRLGYLQDRALFKGDDEWYVTVFLDTRGRMKEYYIEPYDSWGHEWAMNGAGVYNMNREKVGEIELDLTNYITKNFSIRMDLGEAGEALSEMDKTAIYWRCVQEMTDRYSD